MPHPQSIQKFYQVAQERDFTRDFQFRVNTITDRGAAVMTDDDLVYCTGASLPGRTITATQQPYMGIDFQLPGSAKYTGSSGWALNFRADGDNAIRSLFERWSQLLFDDTTSTGAYRIYDNSTVILDQLDQDLEVVRQYKLHGVWPVSLGDLAYNMTGTGTVVTLAVTLAYQFWRRQ